MFRLYFLSCRGKEPNPRLDWKGRSWWSDRMRMAKDCPFQPSQPPRGIMRLRIRRVQVSKDAQAL